MAPALLISGAVLLVVAGVVFAVFSSHVGRAGKPLWLGGGIVLVLAGIALGVYTALTGSVF